MTQKLHYVNWTQGFDKQTALVRIPQQRIGGMSSAPFLQAIDIIENRHRWPFNRCASARFGSAPGEVGGTLTARWQTSRRRENVPVRARVRGAVLPESARLPFLVFYQGTARSVFR
jgi:hypothetical protein